MNEKISSVSLSSFLRPNPTENAFFSFDQPPLKRKRKEQYKNSVQLHAKSTGFIRSIRLHSLNFRLLRLDFPVEAICRRRFITLLCAADQTEIINATAMQTQFMKRQFSDSRHTERISSGSAHTTLPRNRT